MRGEVAAGQASRGTNNSASISHVKRENRINARLLNLTSFSSKILAVFGRSIDRCKASFPHARTLNSPYSYNHLRPVAAPRAMTVDQTSSPVHLSNSLLAKVSSTHYHRHRQQCRLDRSSAQSRASSNARACVHLQHFHSSRPAASADRHPTAVQRYDFKPDYCVFHLRRFACF